MKTAERAILKHIVESDEQIQAIRSGTYRRYSDEQLEQIAMCWVIEFGLNLDATAELPPFSQHFTDDVFGPISSESELDRSVMDYLDRMDWSDLGPKI